MRGEEIVSFGIFVPFRNTVNSCDDDRIDDSTAANRSDRFCGRRVVERTLRTTGAAWGAPGTGSGCHCGVGVISSELLEPSTSIMDTLSSS